MDAVQDSIEQQRKQLIEEVRSLPAECLQEVIDFVNQLHQKTQNSETEQATTRIEQSPYEALQASGLIGCGEGPADLSVNHKKYCAEGLMEKYGRPSSLQEIAQLPLHERHQVLEKYIAETAEDFANDPALTEFSEVDIDDWGVNDGET